MTTDGRGAYGETKGGGTRVCTTNLRLMKLTISLLSVYFYRVGIHIYKRLALPPKYQND